MIVSLKRYATGLAACLLGFAVLLSWATPALAVEVGVSAACPFTTATHAECTFPALSTVFNSEIHYVAAQCNSTGVAFNLTQFQIAAIPPGAAGLVYYQVSGNRASVAGVANTASNVAIYVKINTTTYATIDFAAAPTGATSCTASLSAS
jgi:hypothetical protein